MRTQIAYNQQQRKAWAKTFTYETNTPHSTTSPAFSASLSKPANYISLSTPKPTPIRPIGISTRRHATLAFTLFHAERQTHIHTHLLPWQRANRLRGPCPRRPLLFSLSSRARASFLHFPSLLVSRPYSSILRRYRERSSRNLYRLSLSLSLSLSFREIQK